MVSSCVPAVLYLSGNSRFRQKVRGYLSSLKEEDCLGRETVRSGTRGSLAITYLLTQLFFTGTEVDFHKICISFW